jgi:hypothetical protein
MKMASDASHFPNPQHLLPSTFGLLVAQAFIPVKAYITNEGTNQTDVPSLIRVLQNAFGESGHVATAERKLEALKWTNDDFSSYYTEFQHHVANI